MSCAPRWRCALYSQGTLSSGLGPPRGYWASFVLCGYTSRAWHRETLQGRPVLLQAGPVTLRVLLLSFFLLQTHDAARPAAQCGKPGHAVQQGWLVLLQATRRCFFLLQKPGHLLQSQPRGIQSLSPLPQRIVSQHFLVFLLLRPVNIYFIFSLVILL